MKTQWKFEDNLDKITQKITEEPTKILNVIGQNLVKEVKSNLRVSKSSRRGMLSKTVGYWARKQEGDLQIGFKMSIVANKQQVGPGIVGKMMRFEEEDPISPVVIKNKDAIQSVLMEVLQRIRKEKA